MTLSIVSPCYGAPTLLEELVRQCTDAAREITADYEIILVEDGFVFRFPSFRYELNDVIGKEGILHKDRPAPKP